jgi:hypothetical protein
MSGRPPGSGRSPGRPKSNLEIAADHIVHRRLDAGALTEIEKNYLKTELEKLGAALSAGTADARQQHMAAQLLRALTEKRRGRPKQLKTPLANFHLALTMDLMIASAVVRGETNPLDSVLFEVIELEREETGKLLDRETVLTYYRKGIAHMADRDAAYAREIDFWTEKRAASVESVLSAYEKGDPVRIEIARMRYDRATRRARK